MLWKKLKTKWYFDSICYLWTAVFATLSFAPYSYSIFSLLSPLGLFWIEHKYRRNYKTLLKKGLFFSFVFCLCSYYWINYMLVVFGGFPKLIAFLLFILYTLIVNWKFGVFLVSFSFLKTKLGKRNFLLAGFCILFAEFFTWQIFPWYYGNLLASNMILAQNIEFIGVYGLSALVFILSYAIYKFPYKVFIKKSSKFNLALKSNLAPFLLLCFFSISGFYLYQKWEKVEPSSTKQVVVIQPDAPLEFRDDRNPRETLNKLMEKIESLALDSVIDGKPDIFVLPESGVPFFSTHNDNATTLYEPLYWWRYEALIYQLTNRFKANFYLNEVDASFLNNKQSKENLVHHNNSVLFDPNGERRDSYRKSYLLAFGEYFPLGETFPIVYKIFPQVARFVPGEEQNLIPYYKNKTNSDFKKSHLKWQDSSFMNMQAHKDYYKENQTELEVAGKFLPLICYEVIIPEFVRKFYKTEMPDFIINITNDKWYGETVESYEHLDLARIRSIEYRRWMVRSTNSGTSAFVDHLGRIVDDNKTPLMKSLYYSGKVSVISSEPSFYLKFGNILSWFYIGLFSFYSLYIIIIKKK
jgi:apolipoprotein N-acyltransferase